MLKQVAYASTATGGNVPVPATTGHRRADSKRKLINFLVSDGRASVSACSGMRVPAGTESSDTDGERDHTATRRDPSRETLPNSRMSIRRGRSRRGGNRLGEYDARP
jgi:hypothetical protein